MSTPDKILVHESPTPAREDSVTAGYAVLLFLAALVSVAAWAVTA